MASFLTPCFTCGIPVRAMSRPDPEIPVFCDTCATPFAAGPVEVDNEFESLKQAMQDKPSESQKKRAEMRAARNP